jgi:hypothetical protein
MPSLVKTRSRIDSVSSSLSVRSRISSRIDSDLKCQVSSAEPGEDQVSYLFPDLSSLSKSRSRILASESEFKTRVSKLEVGPRVSEFRPLVSEFKTQVSEDRPRVSEFRPLVSEDRPRVSASADGDKPRVSEFKTRVSASAVGG